MQDEKKRRKKEIDNDQNIPLFHENESRSHSKSKMKTHTDEALDLRRVDLNH